jgi:hypothetical protein
MMPAHYGTHSYSKTVLMFAIAAIGLLGGCTDETQPAALPPATQAPSDDPKDYVVEPKTTYDIQVTEPRFVVPSEGLPIDINPMVSNANVDIIFHGDRLFMAWRTAPYHFADESTRMLVVSSTDEGQTWDYELDLALGTDVREPRFVSFGEELQLLFFQGGTNPLTFEPQAVWQTFRQGLGDWTPETILVDGPEVPWDLKTRNGKAYLTSYEGEHYTNPTDPTIQVYFKESLDGRTWTPVDGAEFVYEGGVSEVAFEFDAQGGLWAVTRNEDGDETGFGSHVCYAAPGALADWNCSKESDPNRYDSPEMFRHGDDIYLVARRDIGGTFGPDGSIVTYSMRPKGTALYRIDQTEHRVEKLMDLPGCGDNAFPSVRRLGPHSFLMANYTSPLDEPDLSWIDGQTHPEGTQIYFLKINFIPTSP